MDSEQAGGGPVLVRSRKRFSCHASYLDNDQMYFAVGSSRDRISPIDRPRQRLMTSIVLSFREDPRFRIWEEI